METIYYTLYRASYGVVSANFKEEMTFENAESTGKSYCKKNGFKYLGTYTASEIDKAKKDAIQAIA